MSRPRSILFLFSDEHAQRIAGCYGDQVVATPNLDRLAARGVAFDNAYTPAPLCLPARASLLTGRLPSSQDCLTNSDILRSDIPTLPQTLSAHGYHTLCIGRLHSLGPDQLRGYDERRVGDAQGNWLGGNILDLGAFEIANQPNRGAIELSGPGSNAFAELDEAVTDAAAAYLDDWGRDPGARPFFLTVGFTFPHPPFVAEPQLFEAARGGVGLPDLPAPDPAGEHPWLARWRRHCGITGLPEAAVIRARTAYYALVAHLDRMIGRILDTLVATGREEEVLVVYASDHGEQLGERGLWWKQTLYDQSAKVPLILSCPGTLPAGERRAEVVSLVDLAPTLLAFAGAEPLPHADGTSFLEVARTAGYPWIDLAFSEYYSDGLSPWAGPEPHAHRMVRCGRWKLIHYHGHPSQLFDLATDPLETTDLSGSPDARTIADRLRQLCLSGWDPDAILNRMARTGPEKQQLIRWAARVRPPDQFVFPLDPRRNALASGSEPD